MTAHNYSTKFKTVSSRKLKRVSSSWYNSTYMSLLFIPLLALPFYLLNNQPVEKAHAQIISPIPSGVSVSPTMTPEPTRIVEETPKSSKYNQEEIENYIRTIFGSDAKVAIAVSHGECNPANRTYPKCQLKSSVENSIGLFQINIQSATTKIHWSRIPGKTLEEKKTWLEDPYNNTLMAYWIFSKSGWFPWSAFTNGSYEKFLD